MRIVCISDTHSMHEQMPPIPEGDVLIHAGDSLGQGSLSNLLALNDWLATLPHPHKILIAGNHDWVFQNQPEEARAALTQAIYLEDSGVEINGFHFWGSPWTPIFMNWAFMLDAESLAQKWQLIPDTTDVLITHGPPHGLGDRVPDQYRTLHVGDESLRSRVSEIAPKLHVFGHIHEDYGHYALNSTRLINASTCNARYQPENLPLVVDLT